MKHALLGAALAWVFFGLLAAVAAAQPAEGQIGGNGVVSIRRKPDTMRMRVELTADGKDMKEALAKLRALQESARKKLVAAGATEASIVAGDAKIGANVDERAQMEMLVRARMGARAGVPATNPAQSPPVVVSASLKAEWPLKGAHDEILQTAHEVETRIRAIKFTADKPTPKTPEEQEAAEEAEGLQPPDRGDDQQRPGEPVFMFVSRISEADRAQALAGAYGKARAEAARLAKAAGVELGSLRSLSSSFTPGYNQYPQFEYSGRNQRLMYMLMQEQGEAASGDIDEAIGDDPGNVKFQVSLTASFAIK